MRVPVFIVGDTNFNADELQVIADRIGGEVVPGDGVDAAIARGVEATSEVLGYFGSDHPVVLYTLSDGHRIAAWNVHKGHDPEDVLDTLLRLIEDHRPHVFVLTEAMQLGSVLRRVPVYRRYQGPNVGEGADVALLVRHGRNITAQGTVRMRQPWTVWKYNRRHWPKVYRRLRIGQQLRILAIHPPTRGNKDARAETVNRIVGWAGHPKEH